MITNNYIEFPILFDITHTTKIQTIQYHQYSLNLLLIIMCNNISTYKYMYYIKL